MVEDQTTASASSDGAPIKAEDSSPGPSKKRKREAKTAKAPKESDNRLQETIHVTQVDSGEWGVLVSPIPAFLKCSSCKKVTRIVDFFLKDEAGKWSMNKSCPACRSKGLNHFKKKRAAKPKPELKKPDGENKTGAIEHVTVEDHPTHKADLDWVCRKCGEVDRQPAVARHRTPKPFSFDV